MKKENGVTLIVLIITIIVILILAGVSINSVISDDGIINEAENASNKTDVADVREQIWNELMTIEEERDYTIEDVYEVAEAITGNSPDTENDTVLTQKNNEVDLTEFMDDALYSYTITENLTDVIASASNVSEVKSIGKSAKATLEYSAKNRAYCILPRGIEVTGADYTWEDGTLSLSNIQSDVTVTITADEYYGAKVNYTVGDSTLQSRLDSEGIYWRIFNEDDNGNIYLITSDYILASDAPTSTNGKSATILGLKYKTYFSKVVSDYTGSASITDSTLQSLNSLYYEYLNNNSTKSTNANIKSVAYMMDTSIWNAKFKGEGANYVIGGPTVEMLFESYNEKYDTDEYILKIDTVLDIAYTLGYRVSWDNGETWEALGEILSSSNNLSTSDSLYVITSASKADGMWLASPAYNAVNTVMGVGYRGRITVGVYSGCLTWGFRPVVCLSSDAELVWNESALAYDIN